MFVTRFYDGYTKAFICLSDDTVSTCNFRSVVSDMYFSDDIIVYVTYVYLVTSLF